MIEAVLYVVSGSILYGGVHHLYLSAMRTSTLAHLQLSAMYLLFAGFILTSAIDFHLQEGGSQLQLARLSMTLGFLLWIALIWSIAFNTRCRPLLLLDLLTTAWLILLIKNISSPQGLLHAGAAAADYGSVNHWLTAVSFTVLASLLFCFYAGLHMFRRGDRQTALALLCGLSVLLLTALADPVLDKSVVHSLYLAPFGFLGFLPANSLYCILLDYQKRRKKHPTVNVPKLTFNSEQTAYGCNLANLQPPLTTGGEAEVAFTLPFEMATVADERTSPPGETDSPRKQGESSSGERGSPGGQGESPSGERGSPGGRANLGPEAVEVAAIVNDTKAGNQENNAETGKQSPHQAYRTAKPDHAALNTVSDNLIDLAVYATMALNRLKRGDADPQALERLCKRIRTKAIKTRRLANKFSRPPT